MPVTVLYSTWPDEALAVAAARTLLEERLAACANVWRGRSVYRWRDGIEAAEETMMILKTPQAKAAAARDRLVALHPYETPCVTAWPIQAALAHGPYLQWVVEATE